MEKTLTKKPDDVNVIPDMFGRIKMISRIMTVLLASENVISSTPNTQSLNAPLDSARYLASKNIIKSTDETGFRLNDNLTRAEMAKIATNLGKMTINTCRGQYLRMLILAWAIYVSILKLWYPQGT